MSDKTTKTDDTVFPDVDSSLLGLLVCPVTKNTLKYDATRHELLSPSAGLAYPIRDGIPIMLIDEARKIDN